MCRPRDGIGPRAVRVLAATGLLVFFAGTTIASPLGVELSFLAGSTRADADLTRYDWDVSPRMNLGGQLLLRPGRLGLGVRGWTVESTQSVSAPGAFSFDLDVRTSALEAVTRFDLLRFAGAALFVQGSGGAMRMSYGTELLRFLPPGGGEEVEVALDPIDGWILGAGAGARAVLPVGGSIGLLLDHQRFELATAHRSGQEIVRRDESFGHWTLRAEIGWSF